MKAIVRTVRRSAVVTWRGRVAADPGLLRLRLACLAMLAVALSSAVLYVVGPAVGLPAVVAMLLGGIIGMIGAFAIASRSNVDAAFTLCGFPLAASAGAAPAALFFGRPVAQLVGFVVVMIAAVYVRRFGSRWFSYGMLAWLLYFFTTFIRITPARLASLLAVVVTATGCLLVVVLVLVPDRPARTRAALRRSFRARILALLRTAGDVVSGEIPGAQAEGRLHARTFRLVEVALILDAYLAHSGHQAAAAGRHGLFDAELAAEDLADAVGSLPPGRLQPPIRDALVAALHALTDSRSVQVQVAIGELRLAVDAAPDELSAVVRAVADALDRLALVVDRPDPAAPGHLGNYESAVELYLGNLPGSTASVLDVLANRGARWSLNTRLCLQTAVAAPLALVLGQQLSPQRYYWSVLACFLVLTGTLTTGEAATKGLHRVVGTVAGLVAATIAVYVTAKHDAAIVTVMLVCVFLGLYFFRVSYALMTFAVTTIMGLLYDVLNEFSDRLLLLRLAETTIGAGSAIVVVLLVLPVRTSDARDAAQAAFLRQLDALLADVRDRLSFPERTSNLLYDARRLDSRLHQLALVARPAGGATLTGLSSPSALKALARYAAVAYRARRLAAAVITVAPGSRPELAEHCEALRQRCLQPAVGTHDSHGSPPGGQDVHRLLDDLGQVLDELGRHEASSQRVPT